MAATNLLYYGDNLDILPRHVKDESVDLVYLDPPFNSNASYNVLFAEHGTQSPAQIMAFEDTWKWDTAAEYDFEHTVEQGGRVAEALLGFKTVLGTSDMLAYLAMMAPRLGELRRVMKDTASIYLHCDPTASHYLKLVQPVDEARSRLVARVDLRMKIAEALNAIAGPRSTTPNKTRCDRDVRPRLARPT